ncbi:MAG: hypothetical protein F4X92_07805 [Gammaproteobacteria bacterium]|nr:hypothetical protein [Gammaproteobacteria bacterium]
MPPGRRTRRPGPDAIPRLWYGVPTPGAFRMFANASDHEDADDCDARRSDSLFKLAVGRAPEIGSDLCSQPTMRQWETAPSRVEVGCPTAALVDLVRRSFPISPAAVTPDIGDTCDSSTRARRRSRRAARRMASRKCPERRDRANCPLPAPVRRPG